MKRRNFVYQTSAGLAAFLVAPQIWYGETIYSPKKGFDFTTYRPGQTLVPIIKVTPDDGYYLHTFYDECPWSPDREMLVVTRLPYQAQKPKWGDAAEICLIDLKNQTIETVYKTKAWSFQVGANAQWSDVSSRYLYTNDIINGQAVCVRIDLNTRKTMAFAGPKYDISPDGRLAAGPDFNYINITQYGYGIPDPPSSIPLSLKKNQMESEGLWLTDLQKNKKKLLVNLNQFYEHAIPQDQQFYKDGVYYLFHTKFNKQGNRIMQVFRCLFNGEGRHASLFTLNTDGENIKQCLPREKWNQKARLGGSGNHPNWHPDGEHIIMNTIPTWLGYQDMMFSMFKYDGSDFRILTEKHMGSGHPSVEPSTRYLISDAYMKQTYVVKGDEIPLRFIDLKEDREHQLCTISNNVGNQGKMYSDEGGSQFKLDPHPAWSRNYRSICFNGAIKGQRQVFIADLSQMI
ncbi:MAG: hypothetical protein ACNS62_01860 [Candidatus Cyclobacteriaceae bacterium M3_2C_046]